MWKWALLLIGAFYLAVVVRYFATILANIEIDADASSSHVIAELYAHKGAGNDYLGDIPWYSTLFFELATKWLPAHREIWEVGPFVLGLAAVAAMGWAASRAADARMAIVTVVLLVCASPPMLNYMLWLNDHMASCYSLAVVAALLMLLQTRGDSIRSPLLAGLVILAGIVVGVNMASDKLLVISAPTSLTISSIAAWRLYPGRRTARAARWAVVAVITMAVVTLATTAIMHSARVYPAPFRISFASSQQIATNLRYWWESIAILGNGSFFEAPATLTSGLALTCAFLTVATVVLMPRLVSRDIASRKAGHRATDAPTSSYLIFWTSTAVLLSVAFIVSDVSVGLETARYLTGVIFAAAAIAPVLARRTTAARTAMIVGASVFALASTKALLNSSLIKEPATGPTREVAREVADAAEMLDATQGYAMYWDAAPLTWSSDMRVRAYPVFACARKQLCPGPLNAFSSWYQPRPSEHTFLITDTNEPYVPPGKFGRPIATYHFGTITMYVYGDDIAHYLQ
jgi:hypothetical protein